MPSFLVDNDKVNVSVVKSSQKAVCCRVRLSNVPGAYSHLNYPRQWMGRNIILMYDAAFKYDEFLVQPNWFRAFRYWAVLACTHQCLSWPFYSLVFCHLFLSLNTNPSCW